MDYLTDEQELHEIAGLPNEPGKRGKENNCVDVLSRLWQAILVVKEQCEEERKKLITEYDVFLSHRRTKSQHF